MEPSGSQGMRVEQLEKNAPESCDECSKAMLQGQFVIFRRKSALRHMLCHHEKCFKGLSFSKLKPQEALALFQMRFEAMQDEMDAKSVRQQTLAQSELPTGSEDVLLVDSGTRIPALRSIPMGELRDLKNEVEVFSKRAELSLTQRMPGLTDETASSLVQNLLGVVSKALLVVHRGVLAWTNHSIHTAMMLVTQAFLDHYEQDAIEDHNSMLSVYTLFILSPQFQSDMEHLLRTTVPGLLGAATASLGDGSPDAYDLAGMMQALHDINGAWATLHGKDATAKPWLRSTALAVVAASDLNRMRKAATVPVVITGMTESGEAEPNAAGGAKKKTQRAPKVKAAAEDEQDAELKAAKIIKPVYKKRKHVCPVDGCAHQLVNLEGRQGMRKHWREKHFNPVRKLDESLDAGQAELDEAYAKQCTLKHTEDVKTYDEEFKQEQEKYEEKVAKFRAEQPLKRAREEQNIADAFKEVPASIVDDDMEVDDAHAETGALHVNPDDDPDGGFGDAEMKEGEAEDYIVGEEEDALPEEAPSICLCRKPSTHYGESEMTDVDGNPYMAYFVVGCAAAECRYGLYHGECVGFSLGEYPPHDWLCVYCQPDLMEADNHIASTSDAPFQPAPSSSTMVPLLPLPAQHDTPLSFEPINLSADPQEVELQVAVAGSVKGKEKVLPALPARKSSISMRRTSATGDENTTPTRARTVSFAPIHSGRAAIPSGVSAAGSPHRSPSGYLSPRRTASQTASSSRPPSIPPPHFSLPTSSASKRARNPSERSTETATTSLVSKIPRGDSATDATIDNSPRRISRQAKVVPDSGSEKTRNASSRKKKTSAASSEPPSRRTSGRLQLPKEPLRVVISVPESAQPGSMNLERASTLFTQVQAKFPGSLIPVIRTKADRWLDGFDVLVVSRDTRRVEVASAILWQRTIVDVGWLQKAAEKGQPFPSTENHKISPDTTFNRDEDTAHATRTLSQIRERRLQNPGVLAGYKFQIDPKSDCFSLYKGHPYNAEGLVMAIKAAEGYVVSGMNVFL